MAIKIYLLYQFGDSDYDSVNPDILVAANFDRAVIEAKLLELTAAGYARFHAERNENVRKARWHEGRMPEIKKAVVDLVEIANEAREPEIRAVAVELLASVNQTLLRRSGGRELPAGHGAFASRFPVRQPGPGHPAIERLAGHFRAQDRAHRDQLLDVDAGGKALALAQEGGVLERHIATAAMALVSVSIVKKALRLHVAGI